MGNKDKGKVFTFSLREAVTASVVQTIPGAP